MCTEIAALYLPKATINDLPMRLQNAVALWHPAQQFKPICFSLPE